MKHVFATVAGMVARGESHELTKRLINRLYANQTSLILRCNLRERSRSMTSKVPLNLRQVSEKDVPSIIKERPRRLPMLLEKVPTCYLALTNDGQPAYMNWVADRADWQRFRSHFTGNLHRELQNDECLFEFAYTFEKFRGLGVMSAALTMIIARLVEERPHLRWGYTYILDNNIPSLKGCRNAGFRPYMQRREYWRAMHLKQAFCLDQENRFPFEHESR
jgi:RimJ/RimL family protein N-acetyltransferase